MADLWSKISDALNGELAATPATGHAREMKSEAWSCRTILLAACALWSESTSSAKTTSHKSALAQLSGSIRELTDRVSPAVVEVIVNGYGGSDDRGRISNQISRRQSSGSGVVVDPSGYIITNAHVIARGDQPESARRVPGAVGRRIPKEPSPRAG